MTDSSANLLKLVYKKNLTDDLGIFRFQPSSDSNISNFESGQYIALGLNLDGKSTTFRDYSISSSPHETKYYEFYIKHKELPDLGRFTTPLFKMHLGETISWQEPRGVFTIEEKKPDGAEDDRQMILVATGTGLAPFMSYILSLKQLKKKSRVVLVHGVSYSAQLGYRDVLEKISAEKSGSLDLTYIPMVSRANSPLSKNWAGNIGRVDSLMSGIEKNSSKLEKILATKVTPKNSIFYLCGYKAMIDHVTDMLTPAGFVSIRNKRKDESFDIKFEMYGV